MYGEMSVNKQAEVLRASGVRIVLGTPETPPPAVGWETHLAVTLDIEVQRETEGKL